MQINVHNFTLTTAATAHITVTSDGAAFHELPATVINALATAEALDLTGFEWQAITREAAPAIVPGHTGYVIKLNKF